MTEFNNPSSATKSNKNHVIARLQRFAASKIPNSFGIMSSKYSGGTTMEPTELAGRRHIIKTLLAGAVDTGLNALASGGKYLGLQANAAEPVKLIDEQKDYSAKALGFAHDGSKTKRTDPKENCGNCKQYKKASVVDGVEAGKCSLLAKGLVKSTGWCRSYLKDPVLYGKV
jgi:hypothetical protein